MITAVRDSKHMLGQPHSSGYRSAHVTDRLQYGEVSSRETIKAVSTLTWMRFLVETTATIQLGPPQIDTIPQTARETDSKFGIYIDVPIHPTDFAHPAKPSRLYRLPLAKLQAAHAVAYSAGTSTSLV